MNARRRPIVAIVLTLGIFGSITSCSQSDSNATPDSTPQVSTTVTPQVSDGVFRLGLLLPESGPGAELGEPLIQVATDAINVVNVSGGILGRDIELVVRDEGNESATALAAVDDFISEFHIDALVGLMSSPIALSVLPRLVENKVGSCSPTATAVALASFPDNGLFVRTTPSDILASEAIAQVIEQTGVVETSIAYPDDPFGRSFVAEVRRSLSVQGISIIAEVAYDTTTADFAPIAEQLTADPNRVITLIGDSESGGRLLNSLLDTKSANKIIVNDALAHVDLNSNANLDSDIRRELVGVAVDAFAGADSNTNISLPAFSTAITDCINLLALAAISSKSDFAEEFMAQVPEVSRGGSGCNIFEDCLALLQQSLNIDYNGITGLLDLDPNGDPSRAEFITFSFNDQGHSQFSERISVIASP
jgi:branched-chain amino acid transport system substrate-binding protein